MNYEKICKLLGGEITEIDGKKGKIKVCKIPRKYYKNDRNCAEMDGKVAKDGSCEIRVDYLGRLLKDNKYS